MQYIDRKGNQLTKYDLAKLIFETKPWSLFETKLQKKILKHWDSLDITFTKFKNDIDHIIDDSKI